MTDPTLYPPELQPDLTGVSDDLETVPAETVSTIPDFVAPEDAPSEWSPQQMALEQHRLLVEIHGFLTEIHDLLNGPQVAGMMEQVSRNPLLRKMFGG